MSVKKYVLEKMTNKELEKYISPDSRFVPQAVAYAFEILQSRGIQFGDDEIQRINSLIHLKQEKEKVFVHENYIKSSNFFFFSIALGFINIFIAPELPQLSSATFSQVFTFGFLFLIGVLIRKGFDWMKYVLLAMMVFGMLAFLLVVNNFMDRPVIGIINVIQTVFQIIALVLLFKIPKQESEISK